MAYATDLLSAGQGSIIDRFRSIVDGFRTARAQNRVYIQTLNELRGLTARELADIGISAYEIPFIAREAARMAK